jgi:hypothetical protein
MGLPFSSLLGKVLGSIFFWGSWSWPTASMAMPSRETSAAKLVKLRIGIPFM